MFLGMFLSNAITPQQTLQSLHPTVDYVELAFLATAIPIAFIIRRVILGRAQAQSAGVSQAMVRGNIIFWTVCDGVCFSGLIIAFISSWTWPLAICVSVPMLLQLLTFPRG